jgi:hypothetical protein
MTFISNSSIYEYTFSLLRNHNIISEKLIEIKKTVEIELFSRELNEIKVNEKFTKDEILKSRVKKEALFLSVAAQWNVDLAEHISNFFEV